MENQGAALSRQTFLSLPITTAQFSTHWKKDRAALFGFHNGHYSSRLFWSCCVPLVAAQSLFFGGDDKNLLVAVRRRSPGVHFGFFCIVFWWHFVW
jgi:hypothetical protein